MPDSPRQIIGVIRLDAPSLCGDLEYTVSSDDSTLQSLFAGLVGSRGPLPPAAPRWVNDEAQLAANLSQLRGDLEREYLELVGG